MNNMELNELKECNSNLMWELEVFKKENKQLKEELVSANESITWWNNRFNAVTRDNKQLKEELKNKPDTEITLQDDKGNKFMLIQTERIDMQEELNKTIERLFNNWNKLRKYFNERIEVCDNRLSSPFCNFEKTTKERLIFSQCLEKLEELEQGRDSNGQ